jgi:hypothetical protein
MHDHPFQTYPSMNIPKEPYIPLNYQYFQKPLEIVAAISNQKWKFSEKR